MREGRATALRSRAGRRPAPAQPRKLFSPLLLCSWLNLRVKDADAGCARLRAMDVIGEDLEIDADVKTIADLPFHVMGRFPKPLTIGRCRDNDVLGLSSKELFERIRDLSLGLRALGVSPGDRVAIVAESRPEWIYVRLRDPRSGRRHGPDLPDPLGGTGSLHPSGLRRSPRDRLHAPAARQDCRRCGICCRRSRRSS